MFVKLSYFCQFYLFVRGLFSKMPSTRAHEARPDTLVDVSARSLPSRTRGRRSTSYFRRQWIGRNSCGFSTKGLILYLHIGKSNLLSPLGSRELCAVRCAHSSDIYQAPGYTTGNMHRFHRTNAAAHTPGVRDTPMCAVLLWLVVFVVAFHCPLVCFSHLCT